MVAEVLEELDVLDRSIMVAPVGCSTFIYDYLNCDAQQAAWKGTGGCHRHKESGLKVVFTYQGDGDLASIGTAEIVHAAMRGERITVIFVNNAIYGMTGGQMAPPLAGQKRLPHPWAEISHIMECP